MKKMLKYNIVGSREVYKFISTHFFIIYVFFVYIEKIKNPIFRLNYARYKKMF